MSIQEVGKKLGEAGRLKLRPLCVCGADEIPQDAVASYTIDRCIAKAVYTAALFENTPPMYVEAGHEQCCPGGLFWLGFSEPLPMLKYLVTVGSPDFMGGVAEHLKATPELFDETRKRVGRITPTGNYVVIGPCTNDIPQDKIRSLILFAGGEQIRNLCALAQFNSFDPFFKTVIPAGPTCSTMIAFPAGMAENAPKDSAYVGPSDPTGNSWLPPDLIIMGIPIALAQQMAFDLEESFICKRSKIAYPKNRVVIKPRAYTCAVYIK